MIITPTIAALLIGIIIQTIGTAYFIGKLRRDVDDLQEKFKTVDISFSDVNTTFKDITQSINDIKIQLAELRKELQFLLAPKIRRKTEM